MHSYSSFIFRTWSVFWCGTHHLFWLVIPLLAYRTTTTTVIPTITWRRVKFNDGGGVSWAGWLAGCCCWWRWSVVVVITAALLLVLLIIHPSPDKSKIQHHHAAAATANALASYNLNCFGLWVWYENYSLIYFEVSGILPYYLPPCGDYSPVGWLWSGNELRW